MDQSKSDFPIRRMSVGDESYSDSTTAPLPYAPRIALLLTGLFCAWASSAQSNLAGGRGSAKT